MALTDIKLRTTTHSPLQNKGSKLTWAELDRNIYELADAIIAINSGAGLTPYNAGTTYTGGDTYYVSYNGNIYKFISATDKTGITPGTDGAVWELTSLGALSHQQNSDTKLGLNTDYEITSRTIYENIARYSNVLKPALNLVDGLSAPPTTTSGAIYLIDTLTELLSTSIIWQSGNTVRFYFIDSPSIDLSGYSAGMYLAVSNCPDPIHDGIWLITAVDNALDYIEVTNDNVIDGTNDSTWSDCYVSHGGWGGITQNDWVIKDPITTQWERVEAFEGLQCYNKNVDSLMTFDGTSWIAPVQILTKKISLSSAQILNLYSTPITAIASHGSGNIINILSIVGRNDFNTAAYSAGADDLLLRQSGATIALLNNAFLESAADLIQNGTINVSDMTSNAAVTIWVASGNPITGDGTIDIYLTYQIIKL